MCWSMEASATLATIGFAGAAYGAYKGEAKELWLTLFYFSLMELLQAYTYTVIDQCDDPRNQIATLLGYIHILFQPFFINMMSLYFVPNPFARKIAPFAYATCFIAAVLMIIKLYPFVWAPECEKGLSSLCGSRICSVSGKWHIAWELPINDLFGFVPTYYTVSFLVPMLYGSWRFTLYHIIMGPTIAYFITPEPNEMAAVWCLLSIAFLLIVVDTPVRKILFVRKWYWWSYPK